MCFVGEPAIDTGGPSQEFWRLLENEEFQEKYCLGSEGKKVFDHNVPALEVCSLMKCLHSELGDDILHVCLFVSTDAFSVWYILFYRQNHDFKYMGTLIAMPIVQGGLGFPVLVPHIYEYITSGDYLRACIPIEDVPDPQVRHLLTH